MSPNTKKYNIASGVPRILFGGWVQQIQLRTQGRENGDLGAVAPLSGASFHLQMSETRIVIMLLPMCFLRNWEFGSALSKLRYANDTARQCNEFTVHRQQINRRVYQGSENTVYTKRYELMSNIYMTTVVFVKCGRPPVQYPSQLRSSQLVKLTTHWHLVQRLSRRELRHQSA
jgi:hypothetical protein